MKYYIDGDLIRFQSDEKSGYVHKDFQCAELTDYQAWLAEGNTPEEWKPETTQPESEN